MNVVEIEREVTPPTAAARLTSVAEREALPLADSRSADTSAS